MEQINDTALRDKLFASVVEKDISSLILNEPDTFGFKSAKQKSLSNGKSAAALFFGLAGYYLLFYGLTKKADVFFILFAAIWSFVGTMGFIGTRKIYNARKQGKFQ